MSVLQSVGPFFLSLYLFPPPLLYVGILPLNSHHLIALVTFEGKVKVVFEQFGLCVVVDVDVVFVVVVVFLVGGGGVRMRSRRLRGRPRRSCGRPS